jgi:hypothetical protein
VAYWCGDIVTHLCGYVVLWFCFSKRSRISLAESKYQEKFRE